MKFFRTITFIVFLSATILPQSLLRADAPQEINLIVGDVQSFQAKELVRVSVTDPETADISDAKNEEVSVIGKKAGQTVLFYWDSEGKHIVTVNVSAKDLEVLRKRVIHVLSEAGYENLKCEASQSESKVIVSGDVPKDKRARLEKVLYPYADQVMNITKDEVSQELIQIDMQITELSTTLDKSIGIDWAGGSKLSPLSLDYTETLPTTNGAKDWFKLGDFNRATAIVSTVNLMIKQGKARDLSRPRLMVSSGKEATINVGGEVPYTTQTTLSTGGGITQQSISFKQYGVTLSVTPTIKTIEGGSKIDVLMNLQVTDIDKSFPITATTTNSLAYKTRSAQSQLLLDDKQTVVFAGLIRYNDSTSDKKVPGLSKIPIVGMLFRSSTKQAPDESKELVVSLTPTIMRSKEYKETQMKMPTQNQKEFEQEVDESKGYEFEPISGGVKSIDGANNTKIQTSVQMEETSETTQMNVRPEVDASVLVQEPPENVTAYVRAVQLKISQAINFPKEAVEGKIQGTVKLKLRIEKDGTLSKADVLESSGHKIFDQDALATAKMSAPFLPFAKGMNDPYINVIIPIVYSQNSSSPTSQAVTSLY